MPANATADEPGDCQEPIIGCGKARSMAAALLHGADEAPTVTPREALGDTDVLNVALDIEVSSLNPGSDNCTMVGSSVMTIKSKSAALTQFTFRLRDNYTITSLSVTDNTGNHVVTHTLVPNRTRIVTLNRTFAMDEVFDLNVSYNGTSFDAGAFGAISVGTHGGATPVVATLSEPFYSYAWWPAKDGDIDQPGDMSDKFTLQMNVTAPNNYVVPSNGSLLGIDTLSGSRKLYHWASAYPIATYLVSFAATNYTAWDQTYTFPAGPYNPAGTMPVNFYIYPGNDSPGNRAAWEQSLQMMAVYRTIYGEYPFVNEKYGIYNFNFGGGMEHQTITGQGTFSESVTAHELGHQWWGDNVTCETWSDIWLNEGFATYTECLWEERKAGGINTPAYFAALNSRRPTNNGGDDSVYVYSTTAGRIFSGTYSYNKGAWVLHMLRHVVGDATFFSVLDAYRQQYGGSAATTSEFATVASAVSGKNLTKFFDQWVFQKGAPTYQYGWQSVNVAGQNYLLARINQTQTATAGSPPQVQSIYEMPVDLSVTIGGLPQTLVVQNDARTEWFVVPVSGTVTALSFDPAPWILRGTATSVAYVAGPPKIVATSPTPGAMIPQISSPSQLTVTFHTPVNCAVANFTLVGTATGVQALTLVSGANVNPAVLNLAGPLLSDTYTLTVTTGVTAVNSGLALDGEITSSTSPTSLPSGDGLTGGNAVIQFTVEPCAVAADIDLNCVKNDLDLDLFVQVLLGIETDPGRMTRSDINSSGTPDGDDVGPFIAAYMAP
ncbi:MAG: M1 family aminopeptidase [Planctomycetota bacterium]